MANIKQIKLPSGTTYDIVDQGARDLIEQLSGYTYYIGVTTTALTDGSTTNPIVVNDQSVTANTGGIVTYQNAEFIFNGTAWQEFGDLGALGALAYKDNASASYTPSGTINAPAFTGSSATISLSYTPSGTVAAPTFTGSQATITASYTPSGNVTLYSVHTAVEPGTTGYKPSGTVSLTAPTITLSTSSITPISSVGSLPTATMPVLTTTVTNEVLTLSWTAGTFDAGALPTFGNAVSFATAVSSVTSGTATFTGSQVGFTFNFSGNAGDATATYTPSGTNTAPTFTGSAATLSTNYTPAGNVAQPIFTGTASTITVS